MHFIGITYRNMGDELVTEAEMTQRQVHQQKPTPAWVTNYKSSKPRAQCSL